jgi:hypothetical protein
MLGPVRDVSLSPSQSVSRTRFGPVFLPESWLFKLSLLPWSNHANKVCRRHPTCCSLRVMTLAAVARWRPGLNDDQVSDAHLHVGNLNITPARSCSIAGLHPRKERSVVRLGSLTCLSSHLLRHSDNITTIRYQATGHTNGL